MKNISNQLCMRNLKMMYGNKKSYGQKTNKQIITSSSTFFLLENSPWAINIQLQLEIDTIGK